MNRAISITSSADLSPQPLPSDVRPSVKGKFIYVGNEKLYIRGVTYGAFRPDDNGNEYGKPNEIKIDFKMMVSNGINAIRTYTVPPEWFLDLALEKGIYVMVGIPWEQHITFLDDKKRIKDIENRVRNGVSSCAGHPSILCYAIGNEIPASIVRWHGRNRIESFIKRLYSIAKDKDPDGLATYVNFPTTEYLQLPFIDLFCFNVYLESQQALEAYINRLHNIACDKPLIMAELGLDSRRNGLEAQAKTLEWQIRTAFGSGCGGVFVFSWTDEWYRGGYDIENWDFGLTTRGRLPKPALASVQKAFSEVPFGNRIQWPSISVIVCTYNGSKSIKDTLESLTKLEYPNYEVIIVNDGSNDKTEEIAKEYCNKYGFSLITTENRGLSNARNTGLDSATGEIIAYLDDDACPDPNWLNYLALSFLKTNHAGIGGPNIAPEGDGIIADCVSHVPGNPSHVLISDEKAEHLPGCNMAFRKDSLKAVGGFDPQFWIAGDDVDICWRLQQRGWTLGFSPSAVVWHHRRDSISSYWKQQFNYGKAEALLEKKWPEKYNGRGNCIWTGQVYGTGITKTLGFLNGRIYHGVWGSAPFQSLYQKTPGLIQSLLLIPEWYLIIFGLFMLSCIGFFWKPLLITLPLFIFALGTPVAQSILCTSNACFPKESRSRFKILKMHFLTACLYLIQPLGRLFGRLSLGLTPWRRHGQHKLSLPWPRNHSIWSESWQPHERRIESIENSIRKQGVVLIRGGDYDSWDLKIHGGLFGALRIRIAVEEHAGGRQMIRLRSWPKISRLGFVLTLFFVVLAILASIDKAWYVYVILGVTATLTAVRSFGDCAVATASYLNAIKQEEKEVI